MKAITLSLACFALLSSTAFGDIIWSWDLTEIPSGWSAGNFWDFNDTGAHLGIYDPYMRSITTSLTSDSLVIPDFASGFQLDISFEHYLDYLGGIYDQPMWTDIEARFIHNGATSCMYSFNGYVYAGVHSWDYLKEQASGTVECTIPTVQAGDILVIEYYFSTIQYGAIYFTFADWTITELLITTPASPLERLTWGALKNSFSR